MKFKMVLEAVAMGILLTLPEIALAQDSCYDLWYARNEIYHRNGYCFQTRLGRQTFGNMGCYTNSPRLSRSEQARVEAIRREERRRGCNVN